MRTQLLENDVMGLLQTQSNYELLVISYLVGIINKIYHMTESLIESDIDFESIEKS